MRIVEEASSKAIKFYGDVGKNIKQILQMAVQLDQKVIQEQSKVSLSDYTMSDPTVLFSKFGSESLLGELTDDDRLLLETTLTEDRVMGAILTPGEFVSMWSTRQGKETCEQAIERIKQYSFGRLE